jgi:hypothetical protein
MEASTARDQRRAMDQQDQYLDYLQRVQPQYPLVYNNNYMVGVANQGGIVNTPQAPPVAGEPARRIWTPGPGSYDPLRDQRQGGGNGFVPAPVQQQGFAQQGGYGYAANPVPQQQPGNHGGFRYAPAPQHYGYAGPQYAAPGPQQQGYHGGFGYPPPPPQQHQGSYGGHGYGPAVPPPPQHHGGYGFGPPPMQQPHGRVANWLNEVPIGRPPSADGSVSSRRSSLLSDDDTWNGGGEPATINIHGSHYSI